MQHSGQINFQVCGRESAVCSILLDHLYLQKIKINRLDKAVLAEAGFAVAFKLADVGVQPDRFTEIKF